MKEIFFFFALFSARQVVYNWYVKAFFLPKQTMLMLVRALILKQNSRFVGHKTKIKLKVAQ